MSWIGVLGIAFNCCVLWIGKMARTCLGIVIVLIRYFGIAGHFGDGFLRRINYYNVKCLFEHLMYHFLNLFWQFELRFFPNVSKIFKDSLFYLIILLCNYYLFLVRCFYLLILILKLRNWKMLNWVLLSDL